MDVFRKQTEAKDAVHCIEMHTTGEPSRIIIRGFPDLRGDTLLDKRQDAKSRFDAVRKRLMHEPRGHKDMYGAIVVQETELTKSDEAHIGLLFINNEGWSDMCGHATLAIGRLLLDTQDTAIFPKRHELKRDEETGLTTINLHVPAGVIPLYVPTLKDGTADPSRNSYFHSVLSFATHLDLKVELPPSRQWPKLGGRTSVTCDIIWGGAFYAHVSAEELGFPNGLRGDLAPFDHATKLLKAEIEASHSASFKHPTDPDPHSSELYGVCIMDRDQPGKDGEEAGLVFFENQRIFRSPTGTAVCSRTARAYARGEISLHESRSYHSPVSLVAQGQGGAFKGTPIKAVPLGGGTQLEAVVVQTEGRGYYVGATAWTLESDDKMSAEGFSVGLPDK